MKGISTILAVILIVIIVVAMISLTYTFASSLIATTTTEAAKQTTTTAERMLKTVEFIIANCDANSDEVKFTLRHTGSADINSGELAAFVNEEIVATNPLINETSLNAGSISPEFVYTGTFNSGDSVKITISAPANPANMEVTCS